MNRDELFSVLLSDDVCNLLSNREKELIELIPEIKLSMGFNQKSKWHVYDVYEHTMHVIEGVPKKLDLRLAALFHDLGKPYTYFEDENGDRHFPRHWEKSQEIFLDFARRNNLDSNLALNVSNLIYYHDINFDVNENLILDVIEKIGYDNISDWFLLKKADLNASNTDYFDLKEEVNKLRKRMLK